MPGCSQAGHRFLEAVAEVSTIVQAHGKFVSGTADVCLEDEWIVGIDHRSFRDPVEELVGMLHEVLVESVGAGHQDAQ